MENSNKCVAVTFFFNIKKLPDATTTVRPVEFYLEKCKPTMSAKCEMVIFCDSEYKPLIEEIRNEYAPGWKTHYIEKNITEYDFFKLNYPIVKANRSNSAHYNLPNERNTPSACITYCFKFPALQIAAQIVPDATHYLWLDFGCSHIARNAYEGIDNMIKNPRSKIGMCYIHYRPHNALANVTSYLQNGNPCSVAATVFTVDRESISTLYTRIMSIFYEMLSKGVGHNCEALLAYMYDRYPDMFSLYYGDYGSCIQNYVDLKEDYHAIRWFFIQQAINSGQHEFAKCAARQVLQSVSKNLINISTNEIDFLNNLINT